MPKINLLNNFNFTTKFSKLVKSIFFRNESAEDKVLKLILHQSFLPTRCIFTGVSFIGC